MHRVTRVTASIALLFLALACSDDKDPIINEPNNDDGVITQLGLGSVTDRYTAELWVRGTTGYTTTWGQRGGAVGNAIKIWDVAQNTPELVDSVLVQSATTLGDVQVSDDGSLLVVAIEHAPNGGIGIYSLANPRKPQLVIRYSSDNLKYGVHTAEVARVSGKLYVFAAVDPAAGVDAKLVIVDISNPAAPVEVSVMEVGLPFIHDVFVRDGLLFSAEWHQGLAIYDIGAQSGSPANPRFISRVFTVGGQVHNVWWFADPTTEEKRYAFVGEEGPGLIGSTAIGDIHVIDVSNINEPREVAFYRVDGAGTHNFSMDETNGILYAAYYNGGVRALDVRGDLGTCTEAQKAPDGRCQLHLIPGRELAVQASSVPVYVWGVQYTNGSLYASDMLRGLYKFVPVSR
jgi:hypothetical protein